jgi:hypothetical protein
MGLFELPELPACDAAAMAAAVRSAMKQQATDVAAPSIGPRALVGRLPTLVSLEHGAAELIKESPEDAAAARYFASIVEACYLVAAADGFQEEERVAVSTLMQHATGATIDDARLQEMFDGFERALYSEGLEKRLDSVAGEFQDFMAREEAMSFAALVAISDRVLDLKEVVTLTALGKRFDFSAGEVEAVIAAVAASLKRALSPEPVR